MSHSAALRRRRPAQAFTGQYREEREHLARAFRGPLPPGERRDWAAALLLRLIFASYLRTRGAAAGGLSRGWLAGAVRAALAQLARSGEAPALDLGGQTTGRLLDFLAALPWGTGREDGQSLSDLSAALEGLPEGDPFSKALGVYATAPDIADYLARNTILPFLLCIVARSCPALLGPGGMVWRLLADGPDRYRPDRAGGQGLHGRFASVADLVTGNLDLGRLVQDVIEKTADSSLLLSFRRALEGLTVLDPTCGTGAFLFAALRVLAPLYDACLARPETPPTRQAACSSRNLFLLSRILRQNLYGVDLLREAVEICRLRLRLEVAAHARSAEELAMSARLPDHLRAGNALTGRVRPGSEPPAAGPGTPFHWPDEFPAVMGRGGFDVVLGNPPFLELREAGYLARGFACRETGAVHALCVERSLELLRPDGRVGMVMPLALVSTQRMRRVQELLEDGRDVWYAHFSWRPARLFASVNRAVTLFLAARAGAGRTWTTAYQKWRAHDRRLLMGRITYVEAPRRRPSFWVPKLGAELERGLLAKCLAIPTTVADFLAKRPAGSFPRIYYRTDGGLYWKVFTDFPPAFALGGRPGHSTRETWLAVADAAWVAPLIAALSSDIFWWWYTVTSNCRHLNPSDVHSFPLPASALTDARLAELGRAYLEDITRHSTMRTRRQRQTGHTETQSFRIRNSRGIIERIDEVLAGHYGLTVEERDFITRYDLSFRMGAAAAP